MIDWTDETLRTLDDLATSAFPSEAGITRDTLKRRIRQGKLIAYRPGKAYLSSYAAVRDMMETVRIKREPLPMDGWKAPPPEPPLPLGLTQQDLARMGLERALSELDRQHKARKEERQRQRELEHARTEPERRLRRLEERRAKARTKYFEKKSAKALKSEDDGKI